MVNMRLWAIGTTLGLCAGCAHLSRRHSTTPAPMPLAAAADSTTFRQLTPPGDGGRSSTAWRAALRDMSPKLTSALAAGAIAGGGIATQGEGVRAVGRLVTSPNPPTEAVRGQVTDALLSSGASHTQIDRLVDAMIGLMGAPTETYAFPFRTSRTEKLSPATVHEAVSAFHDVARSADADYLANPPQEFRAAYSTLFELACAEYSASAAQGDLCAPPRYLVDQPPPTPVVNQDSIDAARARAAADSARADSIARAAADSARADSIARAAADSARAALATPVVDTAAAPDTAHAPGAIGGAAAMGAARAAMAARARAVVETRIYFDFDRFTLRDDARATLEAKLPILNANPDVRIRIEGHADERGSDAYNQALSMRRAEQARAYLVEHGVAAAHIDIAGAGEEHPACTDHAETCWSQNRRDEFVIVAGGDTMRIPE